MNSYYENILNQYSSKFNPQKTPQQIAEEQKIQAYQVFLTTKEGIAANKELESKFNNWLDSNYGTRQNADSNDVKELKDMVAAMAKQIEALNDQLK